MAYSGSDRITIVSLTNGQLLARLADNDAQVYALSEPAVVTLQGDPSQITSWLQQGNDLILQQQDGSTLEFQQFFSADAARQSQLVFQDGASQQQVQLTTQAAADSGTAALTPVLHTSEEAVSTLSISRLATTDVADNKAVAAVETDAAAKADVGATATPAPTISVPFGDGWLNRQEKIDGQTLSGSTGVTGSGQSVTVNISGTAYQATVGDDGKWSLALTSEQLMGSDFSTAKHWINVTATNAEGETGKASAYFFTDVSTPHIAFNEDRDDTINLRTAGNVGATLYGTGDAGDALTVTLGPLTWHTTVKWGGVWQVELTPAQAQQLQAGDYTLSATITDTAKNVGTASQSVTVISGDVPPSVTVDSLSDDNRIDLTAITSDITISGTAAPGSKLVVALEYSNLNNWQLTVDSSGKWSVVLDEADAQKLTPGYYDIKATATDEYGVSGSATLDVNFYDVNAVPTLDIQPVTADDIVQASELNSPLNIYGLVSNISTGTDVEVKIGDNIFHGEVVGGSWNVTIEADVVKTIADGQYTLEISADNGTAVATASRDIILFTHAHSSDPTLTFNPLTADDAFYQNGQLYYTLSGTLTEGALPIKSVGLYGGESLDTNDLVLAADNTFTVAVSAEDLTSSFGLYVSYQDVAGNWDRSFESVNLPDLPGAASADAQQQAADTFAADAAAVAGAAADASATDTAASATSAAASTSDTASAADKVAAPAAAVLHPTINTPFGNGWLDAYEKVGDQMLSGTTGVVGSGQTVTVNISGTNYQASVTATGNWSLALTDRQLAGSEFSTGKHWINVTASNAEGDTGTTQAFFFTDISTPQVTIDSPASDITLDLSTITENYIFSGTGDEGDALTLKLGALTWHVAVDFNGKWQAVLTPEQAQQLETGSYRLQATISDIAENSSTVSRALNVYHGDTLPQVTINDLSDDNRVNLNSITTNFTISGTATSAEYISIKLGEEKEWQPGIDADGSWHVELSEADALRLATGDYTLTATVTDAGGNRSSTALNVEFYSAPVEPTLTILAIGDDNAITSSELASNFEIRGNSTGLHSGDTVTLAFGDKTFTGEVYNNSWWIGITADDLKDVQDGFYTLNASGTAEGGLTGSGSEDIALLRYAHDPVITVNPLTSADTELRDGVLYYEISGTVSNPFESTNLYLEAGGSRTYPLTVAKDGTFALEIRAEDYIATSGVHVDYTDLGGIKYRSAEAINLPDAPPREFIEPTITFNPLTADDAYYIGNILLYRLSGTIEMPNPVTNIVLQGPTTMFYVVKVAEDGTFTAGIEALEVDVRNEVHLEYTDEAGQRHIGTQNYLLPAAPAAETDDTSTLSILTEDNPTDGDSASVDHASATHSNATDESSAAAVAGTEGSSVTGSESAAAVHSENIDGVTTVTGTEGNDTFTLSTLNLLSSLDGGAGQDTLVLSGSHEALDFTSLGLKVSNIETIDLGTSGSNSVTLGQKDLLALTDNASEALTIKGADGSTVTLSTAEGGVWTDVGQRTLDGQQFDLYHNASASHDDTLADVLIQHNLQVQTA